MCSDRPKTCYPKQKLPTDLKPGSHHPKCPLESTHQASAAFDSGRDRGLVGWASGCQRARKYDEDVHCREPLSRSVIKDASSSEGPSYRVPSGLVAHWFQDPTSSPRHGNVLQTKLPLFNEYLARKPLIHVSLWILWPQSGDPLRS